MLDAPLWNLVRFCLKTDHQPSLRTRTCCGRPVWEIWPHDAGIVQISQVGRFDGYHPDKPTVKALDKLTPDEVYCESRHPLVTVIRKTRMHGAFLLKRLLQEKKVEGFYQFSGGGKLVKDYKINP